MTLDLANARSLLSCSISHTNMIRGNYQLECRRKLDNQDWKLMTYWPRSYKECEELLDIYEEKWGGMYYYRISPVH